MRKSHLVSSLLAALLASAGVFVSAAPTPVAPESVVGSGSTNDALFAIEGNRASIVDRIMTSFDAQIKSSGSDAAAIRSSLMALRADHLLSASLSNTFKDVSLVLAEPVGMGPATHRYVTVSPTAAAGFVAPEAASSFVLRAGDDLSVATAAELSKAAATSRVVGYFVPNVTTNVSLNNAREVLKDGSGTGSGSWIGFVAGSNTASGQNSAVTAGFNNAATALGAYVGAGQNNVAGGVSSLVIGGFSNRATGLDGLVGAGAFNLAQGARSAVVGGYGNAATGNYSFVGGGGRDDSGATASGTNTRDNVASGTHSVVVGGQGNRASGTFSFIGGGGGPTASTSNTATSNGSTVVGGFLNQATGSQSFIGGGFTNTASGVNSAIPGGFSNVASGSSSAAIGRDNAAVGAASVAMGEAATANQANSFVWSSGSAYAPANGVNSFNISANGDVHLNTNTNLRFGSLVRQNMTLFGDPALSGSYGIGVQSSNMYYRVSDGTGGNGFNWFKGGIHADPAGDPGAGGTLLATLDRSGSFNLPLALDQHIRLRSGSSLVQGMGAQTFTTYLRTNDAIAFFSGGAHTDAQMNAGTGGAILASIEVGVGSGARTGNVRALGFTSSSDRAVKSAFASVNARDILAKVVAMPITTWVYNAEKGLGVRHIGPVAQDFAKAFKVGYDDKSISSVDASGVALSAIKGLNELVKEKNSEIAKLKATTEAMAREMAAIKKKLGM